MALKDFKIKSGIEVKGDSTLKGDVVIGTALENSNFNVEGNVASTGNLDIAGNTVLGTPGGSNTHIVEGNSDVKGTLNATGNIGSEGDVSADGNVSAVDGSFSGNVDAVDVAASGNVSAVDGAFSGNVDAVNATFTGDISGDNLNAAGNTVLGTDGGDRNSTTSTTTVIGNLDVTRGDFAVTQGDATFSRNVIIEQDLIVNGTMTTKNSEEVDIGDSIIKLNHEEVGTPSENAGLEIERGNQGNTAFVWNETSDKWTPGEKVSAAAYVQSSTYNLGDKVEFNGLILEANKNTTQAIDPSNSPDWDEYGVPGWNYGKGTISSDIIEGEALLGDHYGDTYKGTSTDLPKVKVLQAGNGTDATYFMGDVKSTEADTTWTDIDGNDTVDADAILVDVAAKEFKGKAARVSYVGDHEVGELSDIDTAGIADGEVLKYNAASNKFVPGSAGGSDVVTTVTTGTASTVLFEFELSEANAADVFIVVSRPKVGGVAGGVNVDFVKLLIVHDGAAASHSQYDVTTADELAEYDVVVSGSKVQVKAVASVATSTTFKAQATLL